MGRGKSDSVQIDAKALFKELCPKCQQKLEDLVAKKVAEKALRE